MSILANPIQLQKGMLALFMEQLMAEPMSLIADIATYVKSDSDKEDYAWIGEVANLEEFVDEVHFDSLSEAEYELINKKFVGGISVKRDDLNDEKTGGMMMRIRDLAQRAARYPNKLLIDALVNGTTLKGYDGCEFFSATHPIRGKQTATQSNVVTQTGTTTAFVKADLASAIAKLYNFVDEANEPLNESFEQLYLLYPPAMNSAVAEAVGAEFIGGTAGSTQNVEFKTKKITLIQQPRLTVTSAANFYVGIQDALVRGLVFQDREPFTLESLESGDEAFKREVYNYKVRGRCVPGYGRWQRCIKVG